jgi:hypothetical protein
MDEQLQEDWLDARLREEAPYVDDAGFTPRVVAQLPVRRRQSPRFRSIVLLAAALLASIIAYALGGGRTLADAAAFLVAMPLVTVSALAVVCTVIVMVIGGSFAFIRSRELRQ